MSRRLPPWLSALPAVLALSACAKPPVVPPTAPPRFLEDAHPERFRSARFELSVPLPDGHAWRIDDHHEPLLVATHAATRSRLVLGITVERDLTNRQRCEAFARERGLVHDEALKSVADEVIVGPGRYDSRVSVAALPGAARQTLAGHVFLFGGYMRKCLFVHYETLAGEGDDEASISARLAVARLEIVGSIQVEAFDAPTLEKAR